MLGSKEATECEMMLIMRSVTPLNHVYGWVGGAGGRRTGRATAGEEATKRQQLCNTGHNFRMLNE